MNRTKVILSIFLMLFLLLAGLVLPSFWKSQKKEASGNKGREPAKETTETNSEIETTTELVQIIEKCVPKQNQGHPAKRTFQAIRIEVNNEIEPLYNTVINAIDSLKSGGRLCIITFHSLEDRAVKDAYKDSVGKCTCPPDLPYCVCGNKSKGKIKTKKPILPTEEEMKINSRSKSAKLRIFEKN